MDVRVRQWQQRREWDVQTDSGTGFPTAVYRRDRLLPVDAAARDRLTEALDAAGRAWEHGGEAVQLVDNSDDVGALLDVTALDHGLDHLLWSAEQVGGSPFAGGHGRPGLDRYGVPDRSRGPVVLTAGLPPVAATVRPRVVVLDTGLGSHPWLTDDSVEGAITYRDGTTAGPFSTELDHPHADTTGMVTDPMLGALGTHVGHGTFIAGLLRQQCPQAVVVAPGIMGADGVVAESTLVAALQAVLRRQQEEPGWAAAVVLSLGFYLHTAEDRVYTSRLRLVLLELGRAGVAVFCAAGNDASARPSYPAALAVDPAWSDPDVVPLVSVAALTPDGRVADFSNDGPWVTGEAVGVNVVSTVPIAARGSDGPTHTVIGPQGRRRATTDPDDHHSGFACWSGTSFATPILAGQYLAALVSHGCPTTSPARRALVPLGRRSITGSAGLIAAVASQ